jgi:phosphoglycerate dehydrogenase-like enzyme
LGKELKGKTLGIMGLVRIGSSIAGYASAFGMKVIYWDKEKKKTDFEYTKNLASLLSVSDYIICCLNLTSYTQHIINFSNINNMKKGAIFVNIARGKVVDERALCYSMEKGILSGIGSDVLEEELVDFTSSPLYIYAKNHPKANIIITPHIGGVTFEAWERVFSLISRKILERERD